MTAENSQVLKSQETSLMEAEFTGVYGTYKITHSDEIEVQRYRISVLICGIAFCAGMAQWLLIGPSQAWFWLIPLAISLGLALKWIHIYLRLLHNALQILWALGCIGICILVIKFGSENLLFSLSSKPLWTLVIGPLFAALTGLGFKEFFCFQRLEAVGLTLLIPTALLGHLTGVLNGEIVLALLSCSAFLLLVLALRKFGIDAAADIGDKSVFDYLDRQRAEKSL